MTSTTAITSVPPHGRDTEAIPAAVLRRRWRILAVLCTSLLTIVMANTAMNVSLPTMARELDLTSSVQQWVVDSYALVFAGLLFTAGALGDRYGRKGVLQLGLVLFGSGSAYAALTAQSGGSVIAARAAMGVGAALVMPSTLSILVNVFPSHERARAIAIWAAVAGGGGAIGLLVGGWLAEHYWWGAPFAVNVPVALGALAVGSRLLPRSRGSDAAPVDVGGSLLSIAGLGVLVFGLIEAPHRGWSSPATLVSIGAASALLVAFVAFERRAAHPLIDVRLFRDRRFAVGSAGLTMIFLVMFGFFFIGVQYLQLIRGYSPFASALRMLPFVPVMVVASLSTPRLVRRFGPRVVVGIGTTLTGVGVFAIGRLGITSGYPDVLLRMTVMAAGMGLTTSPMTNLIMSSVPPRRAGVGSATNDLSRELGTTLGVAILGSVLSSGYGAHLPGEVAAMPAETREAVRGSLAGGLFASEQVGGPVGQALARSVKQAWLHGMTSALTAAAVVAFAASALALALLRERGSRHANGASDLPVPPPGS